MAETSGRTIAALLLAALAAAAPVGTAAAQEAGPTSVAPDTSARRTARPGPEIDLSAALLTPLTDLVPGTETTGALQLSTGAGLRAGGIWWLGRRLGLGLGGVWVPADLDRQASVAGGDGDAGVDPGGKVGEADYLAGTAELVLALPATSDAVRIEPFLVAGIGVRHLAVDGGGEAPGDLTDPVAALGGGFRMLLSEGALVRLEARDQISSAEVGPETRIQHDLTVSVGLGVRP